MCTYVALSQQILFHEKLTHKTPFLAWTVIWNYVLPVSWTCSELYEINILKVIYESHAQSESQCFKYSICALHSSYDQILDKWLPHFWKNYKTFLAHHPSFLFLQVGVWYVTDSAFRQCSVLIFHSPTINIMYFLTIDSRGNWNAYLSISLPIASQRHIGVLLLR
jgi:hypothetical protein